MSDLDKNPYKRMPEEAEKGKQRVLELADNVGVGESGGDSNLDFEPSGDFQERVSTYPGSYRVAHRPAPLEDPLLAEIKRNQKEYRTPIFGDIIPEGKVGFWLKNGRMGVVSPGRRLIMDPLKKIISIVDVSEDLISFDQLTIVRIRPGQVGLALQNGTPIVLEEGRHWLEAPEFKYVGAQDTLQEHITWQECPSLSIVRVPAGKGAFVLEDNVPRVLPYRAEPYELVAPSVKFVKMFQVMDDINRFDKSCSLDIIRVRPGRIGVAWENNKPIILRPREEPYVLRAPHSQWGSLHDEMSPIIRLDDQNTLDIVRVTPGQVGLYWEDGCNPKVCQPSPDPYIFRKPEKVFHAVVDICQEAISLGSLHIITIGTGRRGVLWERGVARIIESGQYLIQEANFSYGGSHSMAEKQYELGPFMYVTVEAGEVGVKHKRGELEILDAGTHCVSAQDGETFAGFVSIQQQVLLVEDLSITTLDNVDLKVNAVLTYNIEDPQKAVRGVKNLQDVLRQRTETTLSTIFSHHNYGDKAAQAASAKLKRQSVSEESASALVAEDGGDALTTSVNLEFMQSIQKTASVWWGVHIEDLSVDNIKIVNKELAHDLEQRAVTTVKTETARANATNASEVDLIKAQAQAKAKTLEAQGETAKMMAEAKAQMEITKQKAVIQAEAMKVDAEAQAEVVRIMAKADAEAAVLKAEAAKKAMELEAEGADKLGPNAMRLREWEAQCRVAAEMFKNQRTFIDTQGLPTMAQMLNMNAMNQLGLDFPAVKPRPRSTSITRGNKVELDTLK